MVWANGGFQVASRWLPGPERFAHELVCRRKGERKRRIIRQKQTCDNGFYELIDLDLADNCANYKPRPRDFAERRSDVWEGECA